MSKFKILQSKKVMEEETNPDGISSLDEKDSSDGEKPSTRDHSTEMRLLFRVGTILTNGASK